MSRKLTLRGMHTLIGPGSEEVRLFANEANQLKKGWRITSAQIWIGSSTRASANPGVIGSTTGIKAMLQTDQMGGTPSDLLNPEDNRTFGWLMESYKVNAGAPYSLTPDSRNYVLDPDHLIAREFWVTFTNEPGPNQEGRIVDIAYLIEMEEVKTTPAENILQQVKSVAQDISN